MKKYLNSKVYSITLVLLILFLMPAIATTGTIYVDASKSDDSGDGQSWATAKKYLQSALALANSGDELWVAQGTYYPDEGAGQTGNDRFSVFVLGGGVSVYGGFGGGETSRSQRNWANNKTTLSGDLDQNGQGGYDAYHVVRGANGAVLDGFTITGGNANGSGLAWSNDTGGGMWNDASTTVTNCTFSSNWASYGGGMWNSYSSSKVTNCTFSQNTVQYIGGGMWNDNSSSSLTFTNCIFSGNSSSQGGGMYNYGASPTVTNCTFSGNSASYSAYSGGGMYNSSSSPTVTNCILWGNNWGNSGGEISGGSATVTYCDVQYGYTGEGNIDADPMFGNPFSGYAYDLKPGSPCLGVGTSTGAPSTDILGRPRPNPPGSNPDMGAYEQNADASLAVSLSTFTATASVDSVTLHWRTESEVNNIGFGIYRSEAKDGNYTRIAFVSGAGNSAMPIDYQFTDKKVEVGKTYFYYLEDIDIVGEKGKSETIKVVVTPTKKLKLIVTSDKPINPIPKEFRLLQSFPNPFNPETWIPFKLAKNANVVIRIYSTKGELVRTIRLGNQKAGVYVTKDKAAYWDGKNEQGERVSSGVYFYTLRAGEFKATRRMLIVK